MKYLATTFIFFGSILSFNAQDISGTSEVNEVLQNKINFRANEGQWSEEVLFQSITGKGTISFMNKGLSFGFSRSVEDPSTNTETTELMVWNLDFLDANPEVHQTGIGKHSSTTNYLIGNDESKFVKGVSNYEEILYANLYHKIDLRYYTHQNNVKYDYILKPGADLTEIKMRAKGIKQVKVTRSGEIELHTPWGILIEKKPFSYQLIHGVKKEIDIRYEKYDETTYGFKAYGEYDPAVELIVDPVILEWSTFLGGTQDGYIFSSQIDKEGCVFGAGYYRATFPTTPGVFKDQYSQLDDMFVVKMAADGSAPIYSTYIGGSSREQAFDMAINDEGEVYITGFSYSINFPRAKAHDWSYNNNADAVLLRLDATGSNIIYSTFLGGSEKEAGNSVAVDDEGNAYIMGYTQSADFDVSTGAFQSTFKGGPTTSDVHNQDYFYAKFAPMGTRLFTSYLGGTHTEGNIGGHRRGVAGIAVNDNQEFFICGNTKSMDFPFVTGGYKTGKTDNTVEALVCKFNAAGNTLLYSTLLGPGRAADIALNNIGEAFIVGSASNGFPTTQGSYQTNFVGGPNSTAMFEGKDDVFVTRLSADGSSLLYSTFLGWSRDDQGSGISVSSTNEAYVGIFTSSIDAPTSNCASQQSQGGNNDGSYDFLLAKLNASGSTLLHATYMGGFRNDYYSTTTSLLEKEGCVCQLATAVTSHSPDFPTTARAFQPTKFNGTDDQPTITKFRSKVDVDFTNTIPQCDVPAQFTDVSSAQCTWDEGGWSPKYWRWDFGDGQTATGKNVSHTFSGGGTFEVKLKVSPCDSVIKQITVASPFPDFDLGPDISVCGNVNKTLDAGTYPSATYTWHDGSSNQTFVATQAGLYWVTVGNGSCSVTDSIRISSGSISGIVDVNDVTCFGGNNGSIQALPTGGTEPYTYTWNNGQTSQIASGLSAGTYNVTVKDASGCDISATIDVKEPAKIIANISKTDADCSGNLGSVSVSSSGGTGSHNYLWNNGSTAGSQNGIQAGNYFVQVTDENNCVVSESITVENSGNMIVSTEVEIQDGCDRFGGTLGNAEAIPQGGTGPFIYQWDDPLNQTTAIATGLSVGTYKVVVTDITGCSSTQIATIEEKIQISIRIDQVPCGTCSDGILTGTVQGSGQPPFTYRWDDANEQTTPTATGLSNGIYILLVTDANGCFNSDTITIGTTSIANYHDLKISVFPNPTNGTFRVDADRIEVIDLSGKLVLQTTTKVIDLGNKPKGIYLLRGWVKGKVYHTKLILE